VAASNTAEIRVGRLLEVRSGAGYRTKADVDGLFDAIWKARLNIAPGVAHVTISDRRMTRAMAPEAAAYLKERLHVFEECTQRAATVVSPGMSIMPLQLQRAIQPELREYQVFEDEERAIAYLSDLLTYEERKRLRLFLAGA